MLEMFFWCVLIIVCAIGLGISIGLWAVTRIIKKKIDETIKEMER
ncbi:MAG: hypothetical protein H6Q71_2736 [Firmicutes bacterium]|nr:hypothetical protein [Bacillota bacterium]